MEIFYDTFGFVGAVCLGIIILALFFTVLSWVSNRLKAPGMVKVPGFIGEKRPVNVRLNDGHVLNALKFIGFADYTAKRGSIPYSLANMTIFETADQRRIFVRSDAIRFLEEIEGSTGNS